VPQPAAPPFRILDPGELPGWVVEPGSDDDDELDDDDFDDDDNAFDEYADDDYAYTAGRRGQARYARVASRSPAAPPLGSYESRRAALRKEKRRFPFRIIVPVLALFMIVGAVKLLVLPTGPRLDLQGGQGSPTQVASTPAPALSSSPAPSSSPSSGSAATGTTTLASFASYAGQQNRDGGQLAISSVAGADGEQLAAGSADGYPAIWRQGPDGNWSLADTAADGVMAGRPGNTTLIAVTHGPAGWLAVGGVISGAKQHPVVVTSPDGQAWQAADGSQAFGAPGLYAYAATAGRFDYVIVGEQVTGNTVTAATWWSAGLGAWNRGGGGLDGSSTPSEMFAVTVGPQRFIAVGGRGSRPAVWTSPNGQQWTATDLALPAGATKAALRDVVDSGSRVVAMGNAETANGTTAFAEVSNDDGVTWQEVALPSGGKQAEMTALAVTGNGFVAAGRTGQVGQAADPVAVVWTSADGQGWSSARAIPGPAGGKVQAITGLISAGGTVSGIGIAATRGGAHPVTYTGPLSGFGSYQISQSLVRDP
jgi:hypothetical protein